MMHFGVYIDRFNLWRSSRISDRYFTILLSLIIGIAAGLAAWLLKSAVFRIEGLLTGEMQLRTANTLYIVYPLAGVLLSLLFFRFIIKDSDFQGVPRVLFALSRMKGRMKRHRMYSPLAGASLTAGFGGSIGLESPIISAGSAFGSFIGQGMQMNQQNRMLLIGCGASGAMASIFTTPVAAVIFSLEVLLLDLSTASILPLLTASVAGALTTRLLMSEQILFHFQHVAPFEMGEVPYYLLLGLLCGLVSIYFYVVHFAVSGKMEKIRNVYLRAFIALGLLGLLIYFFPPLYGEGYDSIRMIIAGESTHLLDHSFFYAFKDSAWQLLGFVLMILLLKVMATTLTLSGGGIGGIFAPAAMTGGLSGFLFAGVLTRLFGNLYLDERNFTLVGMAGVLGAVLHAPLTAIFLVAELTKGYELFVPLMITTGIAFLVVKAYNPHSIFTRRLAERGDLLAHHRDQSVLTLMNIKDVIDTDLLTIPPDASLGELVERIAVSKRNIFPVVDQDNTFRGVIDLDDVRKDMFHPEKYQNPLTPYIIQPSEQVSTAETMDNVMEKFRKSGYYNLPVIDQGKYVGFVSRAHVFNAYRKTLLELSMQD
jgi:CIC family chloride channel protein